MNHLTTMFFGLSDGNEFIQGLQQSLNSISSKNGIYCGDNLFTYNRNLSFLEDVSFMSAFRRHAITPVEQAILWRISTVVWAVRNGLRLPEGDFVECACYKGTTVRIVCDAVEFGKTGRNYYLYDLFDHDESLPHHRMPEHGDHLYKQVKALFSDLPNVTITKGRVPDVLTQVVPEKIAFLHLDLNNAKSEIGALEMLFDRLVPGAVLLLDDYGWLAYREQKLAEDPWFMARGYHVLELPTGQGMVIK
jgi:O-methyltransferase